MYMHETDVKMTVCTQASFIAMFTFCCVVTYQVWGGSIDCLTRWERLCMFKRFVAPVAIVQTWGEWEIMRLLRIFVFALWGCGVAPDAADYTLNTFFYIIFQSINLMFEAYVMVKGGESVLAAAEHTLSSIFTIIFAALAGFLVVVKCHRHVRISFHLGHAAAI
jgi:hypothetical protein